MERTTSSCDAPRWRLPGWLHGALLGAWSMGIVWAYDFAVGRGFGVLDPATLRSMIGPESWLAVYAPRWNVPLLQSVELAFVLAVLVGLLLGAFFGWVGRKLDPRRDSREAFWWPIRRVRGFWPVALGVTLATYFGALYLDELGLWFAALVAVMTIACLSLPFGILQPVVLDRRDGAGWWRPRWVGLPAVTAFFLLCAANFAFDWLPVPWWVGNTIVAVVSPALTYACAAVVIDRLSLLQLKAVGRELGRGRAIGAAIALEGRKGAFALWTVAPILLAACFVYIDETSLRLILKRDAGVDAALASSTVVWIIEGWLKWWWLVVQFPAMLFTWLAYGRLYARLRASGD